MARLRPAVFHGASDPRRRAELEFFKACEKSLADDWTAVHSLKYIGSRPSLRQHRGNGEADFVLLHRHHGVLVVEVKGGSIDLREGSWFSMDARGNEHLISNPFVQAEEAAHVFHGALSRALGDIKAKNVVHHCVAFPAVSKRHAGAISTYGPAEIVLYREDLARLDQKVGEIVRFRKQSTRWNDGDFAKVKQLFYPTSKTPGMSYLEYLRVLEELDLLTASQKRTMRQLATSPGRTVIVGGAGTGKTVLGMSRSQQLAGDGKRVLFVCANRSLARHLRTEVEANTPELLGNLKIDTASNFISETARAGARGKDFESRKARFPKREDRFLDAVSHLDPHTLFDCIVLDEAQDIRKHDLELLECVLRPTRDGGTMLILGDPNQQLALKRSESALNIQQGDLKLDLDVNCRNTYEIAKLAHTFTSQSVETLEKIHSGIQIRNIEASGHLSELVKSEVAKIRNEYDPHSIAVLTLNGIDDIAIDDDFFVDGLRQEFGLKTSNDGGPDRVPVYAIRSFQGRESDAVVAAINVKSLLQTYPFEEFVRDVERGRPPNNSVFDDLRRVKSQYERFLKRVNEELVPRYRALLEQSQELRTGQKIDFLTEEFEKCRRREFSPNFRDPYLSEAWDRKQTKSLRVALYSLLTRARVILSIVSDSDIKAFIDHQAQAAVDIPGNLVEEIDV